MIKYSDIQSRFEVDLIAIEKDIDYMIVNHSIPPFTYRLPMNIKLKEAAKLCKAYTQAGWKVEVEWSDVDRNLIFRGPLE